MSDETQTTAAASEVPTFSSPGQPPPVAAQEPVAAGADNSASSRPEVIVGGAFAAGFLFAKLLGRRGH